MPVQRHKKVLKIRSIAALIQSQIRLETRMVSAKHQVWKLRMAMIRFAAIAGLFFTSFCWVSPSSLLIPRAWFSTKALILPSWEIRPRVPTHKTIPSQQKMVCSLQQLWPNMIQTRQSLKKNGTVNSLFSNTDGAMVTVLARRQLTSTHITALTLSLDLLRTLTWTLRSTLSLRAPRPKLKFGRKSSSAYHARIL